MHEFVVRNTGLLGGKHRFEHAARFEQFDVVVNACCILGFLRIRANKEECCVTFVQCYLEVVIVQKASAQPYKSEQNNNKPFFGIEFKQVADVYLLHTGTSQLLLMQYYNIK